MLRFTPRRITGLAALCAGLSQPALAQTGIGTATPNPKAALDITAADKGLLIPRLDSAQRVALGTPPDGLMVFQKNGRVGLWYAFGGAWFYIPDKVRAGDNLGNHTATQDLNLGANKLVGNGGTVGLTISNNGRVGVNTTAPSRRLTVASESFADGILISSTTQPVSLGINNGTGALELGVAKNVGHYANTTQAGDGVLRVSGHNMVVATQNGGDIILAAGTAGDAERLRVGNNGRVGIGTSAPVSQLANTDANIGGSDLQGGNPGSLAWAASQSGYVGMFYNANSGPTTPGNGLLVKTTGANPGSTVLDVSTGASQTVPGTPRLAVKGDGRVGIGTSNPAATLEVSGAASTVKLGGLAGTGTRLVTVDATGNLVAAAALPTGVTGDNLGNHTATTNVQLNNNWLSNDGGAEGLRVDNGGNVGVGTAMPGKKLDVSGTFRVLTGSGAFVVNNFGGAGTTVLGEFDGANGNGAQLRFTGAGTGYTDIGHDTIGSFVVEQNGLARLTVRTDGNVGIGTAAPAAKLDIAGSLRAVTGSGMFRINSFGGAGTTVLGEFDGANGNGAQLRFTGAGTGYTDIGHDTIGSFIVEQNDLARLTVTTTGRVGIGTSAPAATLHVSGAASTVRLGGLAGTGTRLVTVDATGNLVAAAALPTGVSGDNLGNHTATTTLNLGTQEIRGNGGTVGLSIAANGGLIIGQGAGNNVLVGISAGSALTSGSERNTFIGAGAGRNATTATNSFFGGYRAGVSNTTGSEQVFIGDDAGYYATTGSRNTLLGRQAGAALSTGSHVTAVGAQAGYSSGSGRGLTLLGSQADVTSGNLRNATAIGYKARAAQSNTLVLGATDSLAVNVGIGTTTPNSRLSISPATTEAKMTLFDGGSATNHYGFGVSNGQFNYHILTTGDRHVFYAGGKNGNGTELLRIQGDGKVGIGQPTPTFKLDVASAVDLVGRLSSSYTGGTWFNLANTSTGAGGFQFVSTGSANGEGANKLLITTGTANVNTGDLLTLDGDTYKVGIGTTAPAAKLDIQGGADANGANDPYALAFSYRTGGYRHFVRTRHNGTVTSTGNDIDFYVNNSTTAAGSASPGTGNTHVLTMESNNGTPRVGIGTTTPSSGLTVNTAVAVPYATTGSATSFTLTDSHQTLRRFGSCATITIPQASTCPGRLYTIINSNGTGSNVALTVAAGTGIYDDVVASNITALAPNNRITIQSDGSGWIVVGR